MNNDHLGFPALPPQVVGCRSLCKALDQGWMAYYIANVQGTTHKQKRGNTKPLDSMDTAEDCLP